MEAGEMTEANERGYVLGTEDDELWRLGFQHRVWAANAFALSAVRPATDTTFTPSIFARAST